MPAVRSFCRAAPCLLCLLLLALVAGAAPPAGGDKDGAAGKAAPQGFDPASAQKTLEWTIGLWQPMLSAARDRNELAKAAHGKKMDAVLAGLVGKDVDWTFAVERVNRYGVLLRGLRAPGPQQKSTPGGLPETRGDFGLSVGAVAKAEKPRKKGLINPGTVEPVDDFPRPFPVPADEWVLSLKAGDAVRVRGKVAQVRRTVAGLTLVVGVVISDARLTPVPKE